MNTEKAHKAYTDVVLENTEKDKRIEKLERMYNTLYVAFLRQQEKQSLIEDKYLSIKKENLTHLREKIRLQDRIFELETLPENINRTILNRW